MVNRTAVTYTTRDAFAAHLKRAAGATKDPVIAISADAQASHQSVIRVMEAAQRRFAALLLIPIMPQL